MNRLAYTIYFVARPHPQRSNVALKLLEYISYVVQIEGICSNNVNRWYLPYFNITSLQHISLVERNLLPPHPPVLKRHHSSFNHISWFIGSSLQHTSLLPRPFPWLHLLAALVPLWNTHPYSQTTCFTTSFCHVPSSHMQTSALTLSPSLSSFSHPPLIHHTLHSWPPVTPPCIKFLDSYCLADDVLKRNDDDVVFHE